MPCSFRNSPWVLVVGVGLSLCLMGRPDALGDSDDLLAGTVQPLDEFGDGVGTLSTSGMKPTMMGVIGDFGSGSIQEGWVALMVNQWNPDFVVTVGDNNYGPLSPNPEDFIPPVTFWSRWVGAYYGNYMQRRVDGRYGEQTAFEQRFFPAVGNHDSEENESFGHGGINGGTIRGYLGYFHENPGSEPRLPTDREAIHNRDVSYYAVRRGPLDIFVLDSDAVHLPGLIDPQKVWLTRRVTESTARWKIAVFHQPPHTSSFRGAAAWMQWPELRLVDAILCGHDHFYERLQFGGDGPPVFIAGTGGQTIYGPSPLGLVPESRKFAGNYYGALRLLAVESGLTIEFRGIPPTGGGEELIESYSLGVPVEDDFEDMYRFFVEAGRQIEIRTATPPPFGAWPLDLGVKVWGSDQNVILEAAGGAADGRNVVATGVIPETGWYRLVVAAQGAGHGAYRISVRIRDDSGGLPGWLAAQFPNGGGEADPLADPDGDGQLNLIEYALATSPRQPDAPPLRVTRDPVGPGESPAAVQLDVPSPLPTGLSLQLEMSTSLGALAWTVAARKPPLGDWQSPSYLTSQALDEGRRRLTLRLPGDLRGRYFRLRAIRN